MELMLRNRMGVDISLNISFMILFLQLAYECMWLVKGTCNSIHSERVGSGYLQMVLSLNIHVTTNNMTRNLDTISCETWTQFLTCCIVGFCIVGS